MKVHSDPLHLNLKNPVITLGIFDGVHTGHQQIIRALITTARSINGESVVITFWPHPRTVLDQETANVRFLTTLEEKKYLLDQAGVGHLVIIPFTRSFANLDACEFIKDILVSRFGIHHLIMGYNHKFGRDRKGDCKAIRDCAQKFSFKTTRLEPYIENGVKVSSTVIRDALWSGRIRKANRHLGYTFFINGSITGGKRIGTKIGYPTANITPATSFKIVPSDGVYAVKLQIHGHNHDGMLNIGVRPTLNTDKPVKTIEVHIFDFSQNIYGQEIRLFFVDRIRNEEKFENVDALVQQLKKDEIAAKEILAKS